MLTGHVDEQVAVEIMKAGANDSLSKSRLSRDLLSQAVRHAVQLVEKDRAEMLAREREARAAAEASEERYRRLAAEMTELKEAAESSNAAKAFLPAEAPALPAPAPQSEKGSDNAKSLRILLVDDHEDTARAMGRLLKQLGHEVTLADSVGGALGAFAVQTFDVLVSDIGLPDGSGLDLMKRIRQLHRVRGIALSGFGMEEDVQRSRDAGFSDHLTKPISFQRLEAAIRELSRGTGVPLV
jgi:CheY-like chemotaxis protein